MKVNGLDITMFNSPKRKKLNLVRDISIKVNCKDKTYYFNEKAYCSECDGYIDLKEISEEIFNMSKLLKMKTIEVDFEYAQLHIQREIESLKEAI